MASADTLRRLGAATLLLVVSGCDDAATQPATDDMAPPADAGLQTDADVDAGCVIEAEHCNGLDDDCDGEIDEGFGLGRDCQVGQGPCVNAGVYVCAPDGVSGVCGAQPLPGLPEACDGLDNDCDGEIDEGLNLINDPLNCGACDQQCTYAHATGECALSACLLAACDAGYVDANADPEDGCECPLAGDETCNGVDDDCDGTVDESLGLGLACAAGVGACSQAGVQICGPEGGVVCDARPGAPEDERCNGRDDNCDGQIDEGFDADGDGAPACAEAPCDGPCPEGFDCAVLCARQDCAPEDPTVHPEARDLCGDGLDQNCDGHDAPCGEVFSLMTQLTIVAPGLAVAGCRDFDGDGLADNAFSGLAALSNPLLQAAVRDGDLLLLPTAEGLAEGAVQGRFDLSILRGQLLGPGRYQVAADSYDAEGRAQMLFENALLQDGQLRAGPGDFQLGLPVPGGMPGQLRVLDALVAGALSVEADGLRIQDGLISGIVSDADLRRALQALPDGLAPFILNAVEPDLDLDGDGTLDAYSACLLYAAEPANIVPAP
jgi:hypothetical protein